MTEKKRNVPPLFQITDLILLGLFLLLVWLVFMESSDSIEYKTLKISVAVLGFTAIKGLSTISQVYYPYSQENPMTLSSVLLMLISVTTVGIMTAIGTWNRGDNLKEHVYDAIIFVVILYFGMLMINGILKK